jgi:Holliday junction resolvase-like predicted endonuclease
MAKTAKRELGDKGEEVVCRYLEDKGYRILERNYWKPWGEIDIIAEKASKLSFVEVKSTLVHLHLDAVSRESSSRRINPQENMHPAKIRRLHRAIQTYLLDHKVPENKAWQLDLACAFLDVSTHKAKVELLENVIL